MQSSSDPCGEIPPGDPRAREEGALTGLLRPSLLRVFSALSLISVLLILLTAGIGIYRIFSAHIVLAAEKEAVRIGQAVYGQERLLLGSPRAGAGSGLHVEPERLSTLDRQMRKYLAPLEIVKIKVYAADRAIVYSTDPDLIGRSDVGNPRLQRALGGQVVSELVTKEEVGDLAGERRFDVDVVETYLPIRDEQGDIVGSFELYMDVTHHREQLWSVLRSALLVLLLVLVAVFGGLYALMRRASRGLAGAQRELERLAVTDPLTGLSNRRQLIARCEEEFARFRRLGEGTARCRFSLVMLDIDHFKRINDAYGHGVGDRVLKAVADCLRRSVRRYDIVGRYGGEEFVAVLPGADGAQATAMAERLVRAVREAAARERGRPDGVTVSAGVATVMPEDAGFEAVLVRADEGLYAAKRLGRDRVGCVETDHSGEKGRSAPLAEAG